MNVLLQREKLMKNLDLQLRQKVGLEIHLMLLSDIELLMQMMINCDVCSLLYSIFVNMSCLVTGSIIWSMLGRN